VDTFASFERLPPIDTSDLAAELPADYVAVRFYFNESFPDTEENKQFVTRLIETLTERGDVVLLNPDLHIDDHWEMQIARNPRIHSVDRLMTPRNNLEIQTKVIARSRAFVGTYGGLSYLAPMYGVTALAFYSHREKFSPQHLEVARRVFGGFRRGSYVVLDTSDVEVLGLAFGERLPFDGLLERGEAAVIEG
jgi:ADP-heptose:LPS heptosyltransferase